MEEKKNLPQNGAPQNGGSPQIPSPKNLEEARKRILQVEATLNRVVVGHEEMIRALMLALVAGEHMVIIGPPGTAKSYSVRLLAKLLDATFYLYQLTKYTTYDELYGTVDVTALAKGEFKRRWSALIDAQIVFLDEIFKANSAILNSLLSLLQERVIYDPMTGEAKPTKLHTVVGASNEVPLDEELQALYDRFIIRVFIGYLDDDAMLLKAIESRWLTNGDVRPLATMNDVKTLHSYALQLITAKVKELDAAVYKLYHIGVMPMAKALRSKGIIVSDRTLIEKLPKLFAAYLTLYGVTAENISFAGLELIKYLARDKSELKEIEKTINDALGEVGVLAEKLEDAKKLIRSGDLQNAEQKLTEILSFDISKIKDRIWLKPRVEAIMNAAREYLTRINDIKRTIKQLAGE